MISLAACNHGLARVAKPHLSNETDLRSPVLLRQTMLDGQNAERMRLGLPPLVWDETLAVAARTHAEAMARAGQFIHSSQGPGGGPQGQNLWMGTRDAYRFEQMLGKWLDERQVFVDAPAPGFSTTGSWKDAAHYSQIVWRSTRRMGCAIAFNARNEYLACRYLPAGNVVGQAAY